jgi:hypothetical protein
LKSPINTGFFNVEGKSRMDSAENSLFMRVFEFREAHKIIEKEGKLRKCCLQKEGEVIL